LLARHPDREGIVFDLPTVVGAAEETIRRGHPASPRRRDPAPGWCSWRRSCRMATAADKPGGDG
jgi:hypothetical protein